MNKIRIKVRKLYQRFLITMYKYENIIPYTFTQKINYFIGMKTKLNLKEPQNFNEKIQWMKAYYRDELHIICADKYKVRDYLIQKGLGNYLNELYGVFDNPDQIDFSVLPQSFVIKTNQGCGTNIIVPNKEEIKINEVKKQLQQWLLQPAGEVTGEMHYKKINPKIIIEKYLGNKNEELPLDYKIFCFNGEPKFIRISADRDFENNVYKHAYFDFNWNYQDFVKEEYYIDPREIERPSNLKEMYEISQILSQDFPFVRVDLFSIDEKIVFGELTFTPTGGFGRAFTDKTNLYFGDLLELPTIKKEGY